MSGIEQELIAALATPSGGALGILRLSGAGSLAVFSRFTGITSPEHAKLRFCRVRDENGDGLDDAMCVFFFAPHSYTGEDSFELHLHGSPAVMRRALRAAVALGARIAEPGEFTRRAFMAGKLKLSEAEAVMDEINSETDRSARTALKQLRGGLTERVGRIEALLLSALAGIDAAIDYPEELDEDISSALPETLDSAAAMLDSLIKEGEAGRAVREGARIVIVGAPNAGKSTLLNALAGEDRAIVTSEAGTTRDVLEAQIELFGVPVTVFDTAGLREAESEAERIGVERARKAIATADLVIYAVAPDDEMPGVDMPTGAKTLVVYTKLDVAPENAAANPDINLPTVSVAALTGKNMPELRRAIAAALKIDETASGEYPTVTNVRHIHALKTARLAIADAASADISDLDSAATDIRSALVALGAISGKDVDANVVNEIFAKFCVGK